MKAAPLQLFDYKVLRMQFEANRDFDPQQHATLCFESISAIPSVKKIQEESDNEGSIWEITLHITQSIPADKNIPYEFELFIGGRIFASPTLKPEDLEKVVNANAPALLYGVAREVVRSATSLGPYAAVILPSTNFIQEPQKTVATKKKAAKKKVARKATKKTSN